MNKVLIIIFVVALFTPSMLYSQVEKQVEVTKAFVPKLDKASKLSITPDMSDTVKMRPEIDYSITPLTLKTELATRPIKPATVTYWEFNRPEPIYIKIGGGYPANSVADIYYSSQNPSTGYIVGYANHDGRYADIKNNFDLNQNAMYMSNRGGIAAGKYLGRQTLEMDVNYFNQYNSRYGAADIDPESGLEVNYDIFNVALRYGDDFVDLSRFNFNLAVAGSIFNDHSDYAASGPKVHQMNWSAEGSVARMFGNNKFLLDASYEMIDGEGVVNNYSQQIFNLGLHYSYEGDVVNLKLGADYYHDYISSVDTKSYFIPKIKLAFNMGGAFSPYVTLDGEFHDNSYKSLIEENPYVAISYFLLESSVDYNLRFGIEGNLAYSRFAYRIFGGWSVLLNNNYWHLEEQNFNGTFSPYLARLDVTSLNGELSFRPVKNLLVEFEAHAYLYSNNDVGYEHGRPSFTADATVKYSVGLFTLGVYAEFQSVREWSGNTLVSSAMQANFKAPASVNIKADVNCKISGNIDIFAELGNLANAKLYEYPYYPEYGINFTAGVKLNF